MDMHSSFFHRLKNKISAIYEASADLKSNQILLRQIIVFLLLIAVILAVLFSFISLNGSTRDKGKTALGSSNQKTASKIKLEIASSALDPERMWRNHFEDKLQESQQSTNLALSKIAESINASSESTLSQAKDEISALKEQILEAKRQLEDATYEMREFRLSSQNHDSDAQALIPPDIDSFIIEDDSGISMSKDSKIYIPETSYIEGSLLAGIAVSTSLGSSSEPVPVVIRITGRGNLPKNFSIDVDECRILGSSYGDLSSERAVIRAESMVCVNKETDEVVTTKIAGVVYGDDGMNGIKGRVIDMSSKHIKNAAIGGLLSGFAGTMKSEGQFAISSLGAINTKQKGFDSKLKDNALSGASGATEKIADYYIKQAENMSPVLLIPGGSRVDVVFTKGVYLGSSDIVRQIDADRKKLADQTR